MSISGSESFETISTTPSLQTSCFGNLFYKLRHLFRKRGARNSRLSIHAVDSENPSSEPNLNQLTVTVDHHSTPASSSTRSPPIEPEVLSRRKRPNRVTREALESALKLYESKHKNIIQYTCPLNPKYGQSSMMICDSLKKSKSDITRNTANKVGTNGKLEKNFKLSDHSGKRGSYLDVEDDSNSCFDVETVSEIDDISDDVDTFVEISNRKKVSIDDKNVRDDVK